MAERYTVRRETLEAIADKIREKKYIDDQMTPAQMVEEMDVLGYNMELDIDESCTSDDWVRPPEYPDPTVIDLTDFDGLYLTYDLRKTPGYGWIGIYCDMLVGGHLVNIERGHIEGSEFVADESFTMGDVSCFRQDLDETKGEVQLWRVWSDGHFKRISFVTNTGTAAKNYINTLQPVVERYGRLPYATDLSSSPNATNNNGAWGTRFLEREDIRDVTEVTTMASAYNQCYNLREIHFDGWDTSKCISFSNTFDFCMLLKHIPLEHITTDSATTFTCMFRGCRCLDNININHFNIDKVTTFSSLFDGCKSLKHLEMSSWKGIGKLTTIGSMFWKCTALEDIERNIKTLNVENVTNFGYAFGHCYRMKHLDLSSWNVQKATSMLQMFTDDYVLEVLNLTGWDVSHVTSLNSTFASCNKLKKIIGIEDWELLSVTNIASMFANAYALERFEIKAWDISALTTSATMFSNCYSLREVTLTGWDVPNILTTVATMFGACRSLKKIHLPNLNFTASAGVALNGFLNGCWSLEDLDISGWHIAKINTIENFFSNCRALNVIDLTDWIVDDGEMTAKASVNYVFSSLYNCKSIKIHFPLEIVTSGSTSFFFTTDTPLKYLDIRNWDISLSTNSYTPNIPTLEVYYPPKLYPVNQSYADAKSLTPDSVVRILEALPEVAANSRTITLGINKLKLTDEQLAIATDKGWKVA